MRNILVALGLFTVLAFSCASSSEVSPEQEGKSEATVSTNVDPDPITEEVKIHWISIEEAELRMKTEPRKMMVDVYTSWCGPCKMMMKNTFTNPEIIRYINENYYAVKFNAESPDTIVFKGKQYTNPNYNATSRGRNGTHELTYAIAQVNGRIAYPTLIYIDEKVNLITGMQGYLQPVQLEPILHFIEEDRYKTDEKYENFITSFKSNL